MSFVAWERRPRGTELHTEPDERVVDRRRTQLWTRAFEGSRGDPGLGLLSSDERRRAERLRSSEERVRFVRRRAFLREILGGIAGAPPERVLLPTPPSGRPSCTVPGVDRAALPSDFSVARSEDIVTVAVAFHGRVGVDLEALVGPLEPDLLAVLPDERRWVARLGSWTLSGPRSLYRRWTRAEAVAKLGDGGLAAPSDPSERPRGLRVRKFSFSYDGSRYVGALGVSD